MADIPHIALQAITILQTNPQLQYPSFRRVGSSQKVTSRPEAIKSTQPIELRKKVSLKPNRLEMVGAKILDKEKKPQMVKMEIRPRESQLACLQICPTIFWSELKAVKSIMKQSPRQQTLAQLDSGINN